MQMQMQMQTTQYARPENHQQQIAQQKKWATQFAWPIDLMLQIFWLPEPYSLRTSKILTLSVKLPPHITIRKHVVTPKTA
jgi:hypothetical protein